MGFGSKSYHFRIPEHSDGRRRTVADLLPQPATPPAPAKLRGVLARAGVAPNHDVSPYVDGKGKVNGVVIRDPAFEGGLVIVHAYYGTELR